MGLTFKNVDYSEYADYVPKSTPRHIEGELFRVVYEDDTIPKIHSKDKRKSKVRNSMKKFNKNIQSNTKTATLKEKINLSQQTLLEKNANSDKPDLLDPFAPHWMKKSSNNMYNLDNVPKDAVFGSVINSIFSLKDMFTNKDINVPNNPSTTGYIPKESSSSLKNSTSINDMFFTKNMGSKNYNGYIPKAKLQHPDMDIFGPFESGPLVNGSSYAPYPNIYDKKKKS